MVYATNYNRPGLIVFGACIAYIVHFHDLNRMYTYFYWRLDVLDSYCSWCPLCYRDNCPGSWGL